MTADGREDVVEHPRLELPGGGQLGGDKTRQSILRVGVAEGGGDIFSAEQELPLGGDGSDRAELVVGERL